MDEKKQKSLLISIVRLLSTNGHTIEEIASELAISPRILSSYIIGTRKLEDDTISDICSIYKVSNDDIKKYKNQRLTLENKTKE